MSINEEFAKIPLTVGSAMENINTAFGQYVLEVNKGSGATAGLAQSVNSLAMNLTPIIEGLVTLGKIAVTVFVAQMAGSIAAYIAATKTAISVESAHSAAIMQNLQVNIARAESTVATTAYLLAYEVAQLSTVSVESVAGRAKLALIDITIAQSRATIAATSATIQTTSTLYIQRQAEQALGIAEAERTIILAKLTQMGEFYAITTNRITAATDAAAVAAAKLKLEQEAGIVASTGLAASFRLLLNPLNLLNIGFAALIGWEIGTWLNSFTAVANQASYAMGEWAKKFETLSYWSKLFTTDITDTSAISALTAEHQKNIAAIDDNINGTIAYRNALSTTNAVTDEAKALVMAFRSPQEVFNDQLKTTKALLDSGQISFETYTKAMAKYQGALDIALSSTAVTEFSKAMAKLNDDKNKLTMTSGDYNRTQGEALKLTGQELEQYVALKNQIDTLTVSKKATEKASSDEETATKKAATASDTHNKKILELLQSLSSELYINTLSAKDKALQIALRTNLKDAIGDERVEIELITKQIAAETETRRIQQSMWDETISQANELDKLKDDSRYAVELANMAKSLQLQGFSNAAIKEQIDLEKQKKAAIEANFYLPKDVVAGYTDTKNSADQQLSSLTSQGGNLPAKGSGIIQKETTETARVALEAYNKTLDDAHVKTSDLGAVTSAIFDGALGGINAMAGAFDNMVNSINKSSLALDENAKMQVLNESTVDQAAKASNAAKYAKEESDLNGKILSDKLSGTRQIAGAVSAMLTKGSTEQRAAHAIEMGIAGAQMAQTLIKLFGIGAVSAAHTAAVVPFVAGEMVKGQAAAATGVATQAAAGPYIGFALMAAMAVAMAAIGFGVGGGSTSVAPVMPTSPDTGTVLGDSTAKSESIDKTYDLLKSIHADEYSELRGINSGVAALSSSITNVITRLYQGGGLANVTAPKAQQTGLNAIPPWANYLMGTWIINSMFGGKKTNTVTGQGISTGATSLNDVMNGGNIGAQQYTNIETKTAGGWFTSNKYKNSTQYQAIDKATQAAMNDMFSSMGSTMLGLADNLGGDLATRVKDYVIPAFTVELKGLSGEDAAKKLNGVISTALDTMSTAVFGDIIGQYQKLGEGMLETAVRIVSEVAVVKDALATSGLSLATNAIAISDALVQAAGGLAEFQKQFESFYDKFYTGAEKQSRLKTNIQSQLATVNPNAYLPASRVEYRQFIEALDLTPCVRIVVASTFKKK
ncbi:hypothetical protein [Methylobacter sp. S3L5C]|uniref:hypothetical protein n=1 Tax=Methylobacter sp. S3L5C TaxID=2839024 RepID=UPI001FAE481D|nr:hypothetical protein [Methylobacter sp. S3L5C]UOA07616.1 hypothetical protein KKZ03_15295 [Methylobacter sp. S3L5C]